MLSAGWVGFGFESVPRSSARRLPPAAFVLVISCIWEPLIAFQSQLRRISVGFQLPAVPSTTRARTWARLFLERRWPVQTGSGVPGTYARNASFACAESGSDSISLAVPAGQSRIVNIPRSEAEKASSQKAEAWPAGRVSRGKSCCSASCVIELQKMSSSVPHHK